MVGTVDATAQEENERVDFVEVALTFDPVQEEQLSLNEYPIGFNDAIIRYRVDEQNDRLILNDMATDSMRNTVRENESVAAKGNNFSKIPTTLYDSPMHTIGIGRGSGSSITKTLGTDDGKPAQQKNTAISYNDRNEARIKAENKERDVPPESATDIPLKTSEIRTWKMGNNVSLEEDRRNKGEKRPARNIEKVTITAEPNLWIKNYGELTVHSSNS